jgi:hypothetical protein
MRKKGHKRSVVKNNFSNILPGGHLVDEYPHCPPVDGLVVAPAHDDFGREVLGRATQGPRP